jgi:hypothetical protein
MQYCYICNCNYNCKININDKYCSNCFDIKNQIQNDNITSIDIYTDKKIEIQYRFIKKIHYENCYNYDISTFDEHIFTKIYPLLKIFNDEDIKNDNSIDLNFSKDKLKYYEFDVFCDCECNTLNDLYPIIKAHIKKND